MSLRSALVTQRPLSQGYNTKKTPVSWGRSGNLRKHEISACGGSVWKTRHRALGSGWMDMYSWENKAQFHQPQGATDAKDSLFLPVHDLEISRTRKTPVAALPCLFFMAGSCSNQPKAIAEVTNL